MNDELKITILKQSNDKEILEVFTQAFLDNPNLPIIYDKPEFTRNIIKNLMDYALKIKGFLELSEENKEDLIQEIFNSNDLEHFEKIKQDRSKITTLGPIQIVRNQVLLQFIEDKKQNLTTTSMDTKFVKNIIET